MEESNSAPDSVASKPTNPYYHINEVTLSINGASEVISGPTVQSKPPIPSSPPPIYHNEITIPNVENLQARQASTKETKPTESKQKPSIEVKKSKAVDKIPKPVDVPTPKPRTMSDPKSQDATDSNGGVDNRSFEPDNKRASSFGRPNPITNGHSKEKQVLKNGELNSNTEFKPPMKSNGDTDLHEAVNLELVNMDSHRNGLPVKKETEVDIGDPYDEYFVPVNEHRKYMRGEKLYVTMDKRTKSRWRKILCWAFGLALLFCAILIAILAATGVILTNDATPIETTSTDSRGFTDVKTASAFGAGGIAGTINTGSPPLSTIPISPPTTDMSKYIQYVPNALQGTLILDNVQFKDELSYPNSTEFKKLALQLESELMKSLFDEDTLNYGSHDISLKVIDFKPGSVVVTYRVSWVEKPTKILPPIDENTMIEKIKQKLNNNNGYISNYHVTQDKLEVTRVPDKCLIDNNGCINGCKYEYSSGDFVCMCAKGEILMEDGKTCIQGFTQSHNHDHHDHHIHDHTHSTTEQSLYDVERHAKIPFAVYDEKEPKSEPTTKPEHPSEPKSEPQPSTEEVLKSYPTSDPRSFDRSSVSENNRVHFHVYSNTHDDGIDESEEPLHQAGTPSEEDTQHDQVHFHNYVTTAKDSSNNFTISELTIEPKPTSDPVAEPKPTSEPQAKPEPTSEPQAEPQPTSGLQAEPEPTSEPQAEPEPTSEPQAEPEPTSEPQAEPESTPDIRSIPELIFESEGEIKQSQDETNLESKSTAEITTPAEPLPNSKFENKIEAESTMLPKMEPMLTTLQPIAESEPTSEFKPEPEPTSEPKSEVELAPEPKSEPQSTSEFKSEHEPTSVPKSEPEPTSEPKSESEPTSEPKSEPEPTSGPKSEPELQSEPEPTSEPQPEPEPTSEPQSEPEPTSEPKPDPELTSDSKPELILMSEPKLETEDTSEVETKPEPTSEPKAEPEPTSEPEPASESKAESEGISHLKNEHELILATKPELEYMSETESSTQSTIFIESNDKSNSSAVTVSKADQLNNDDATDYMIQTILMNNDTNINYLLIHELNTNPPPQKNATHVVLSMKDIHNNTSIPIFSISNSVPISKNNITEEHVNNVFAFQSVSEEKNETDTSRYIVFIPPNNADSSHSTNNFSETATEKVSRSDSRNEQTQRLNEFNEKVLPLDEQGYSVVENVNEDPNTEPPNSIYTLSSKIQYLTETNTHPLHDDQTFSGDDNSRSYENGIKIIEVLPEIPNKQYNTESNINEATTIVYSSDQTTASSASKVYSVYGVQAHNNYTNEIDLNITPSSKTSDFDNTSQKPISESENIQIGNTYTVHENFSNFNSNSGNNETEVHSQYRIETITETAPGLAENMSPFLPEVENNAALINILHKGHDIDLNETELSNESKDMNLKENPMINHNLRSGMNETFNDSIPPVVPLKQDMNNLKDDDITKLFNDVISGRNFQSIEPIEPEYESHTMVYDAQMDIAPKEIAFNISNEKSEDSTKHFTETTIISNMTEINSVTQIDLAHDDVVTKSGQIHSEDISKDITTAANLLNSQESTSTENQYQVFEDVDENEDYHNSSQMHSLRHTTIVMKNYEELDVTHAVKPTTETPNVTENVVTTFPPLVHVLHENLPTTIQPIEETTIINNENDSTTSSSTSVDFDMSPNDGTTTKNQVKLVQEDNFLSVLPLNSDLTKNEEYLNKKIEKTLLEEADLNDIDDHDKKLTNDHKLLDHATTIPSKNVDNKNFHENHFLSNKSFLNISGTTLNKLVDLTTEDKEFENQHRQTRCLQGQFQCLNSSAIKYKSSCIASNHRCDGVTDCLDGSDEFACAEAGCESHFQCHNGACLARNLVCDGLFNCADGSDEIDCGNWRCQKDEMSCGIGSNCIPLPWRCNGRQDCSSDLDESNCAGPCASDQFQCVQQGKCIPITWRCDGQIDCQGDEDELACDCPEDSFRCETGGGCATSDKKCDGLYDCSDRSDEWNCISLNNSVVSETQIYNDTSLNILWLSNAGNKWLPVCSTGWSDNASQLVCQELGFGRSLTTETMNITEEFDEFYTISHKQISLNQKLMAQVQTTNKCDDALISVTCEIFSCGFNAPLPKDGMSSRIAGGEQSVREQWPSVALVFNTDGVKCTSTIISPKWVISSLSCLGDAITQDTSNWQLFVGSAQFSLSNNLKESNDNSQIRSIKNIIIYPQAKYRQFMYEGDIVLLELSESLSLSSSVNTACLVSHILSPREICMAVGWGIQNSLADKDSDLVALHYLPVPIIASEMCNSSRHFNALLPSAIVCAGYTGSHKTPCYNDEAAPLMCFSEERHAWGLQGSLSYHGNCGRSPHPAVFSLFTKSILKWVENTVGNNLMLRQSINNNV